MANYSKREKNILDEIKKLDISPTMYLNAKEKYQAIAKYLQNNGVECEFYPQGSFATGTIVRPIKYENTPSYDLDAVCKIIIDKNGTDPDTIKSMIGDVLKDSGYTIDKEFDTCWTVKYADVNGVGFSIDIVPAVEEDDITKRQLSLKAAYPELIDSSIAITFKENDEYIWHTNNPKGLISWFSSINSRFKDYNRDERRLAIFNENQSLFNSVEEIPDETERSALQIAIQLLKRHRDLFYAEISSHNNKIQKPTSAIILILSSIIAQKIDILDNPFVLVSYIVNELKQYSELQIKPQHLFEISNLDKKTISKKDNTWCLVNPANPEDNLLDNWNDEDAKAFFNWIDAVYNDYSQLSKYSDLEYSAFLENAIGKKAANTFSAPMQKSNQNNIVPQIVSPAKPWSNNYDI